MRLISNDSRQISRVAAVIGTRRGAPRRHLGDIQEIPPP